MKKDPIAELIAVDRWSSRRRRSVEFLREHGIGGLLQKMQQAGVSGTAGFILRQFRYQACSFLGSRWDRKFGVDTSGQIDLFDVDVLGPNKEGGYASVSTSPAAFRFLSGFFPKEWKTFTFVDIGCGKGRALLLAAIHGFDTIFGIEFAPLICQIADKNLARFSGRRPKAWSVINADATTAKLPSHVPLLIYCFNPFKSEVWEKFILVLTEAQLIDKRPMFLILCGTIPEELKSAAALIEATAGFRKLAHGVTPFFFDAYAPYHYWVFDFI